MVIRRLAALGLALCLILFLCACTGTDSGQPRQEAGFRIPGRPAAAPKPVYEDVRVYVDGLLRDRGYRSGETVYLSPELLAEACGFALEIEADGQSFALTLPGLRAESVEGQELVLAGGRYFYLPEGTLTVGGKLYLPTRLIEELLSVSVAISSEPSRADVDIAGAALPDWGEDYYERRYGSEDLYWLSHIIHAETEGQPLAGRIGVGNVVLNRVESPAFPDSVREVILDRENTVQFEPVASGTIEKEPDELSTIAACLCLDGYNTVADSLYFINPRAAENTWWFENDLIFVVSIGDHNFYTQ